MFYHFYFNICLVNARATLQSEKKIFKTIPAMIISLSAKAENTPRTTDFLPNVSMNTFI